MTLLVRRHYTAAMGLMNESLQRPKAFRSFLQDELVRRCQANQKYSLRAFARQLGMDPTTLSKILNGRRAIGPKLTLKLAARLGLSPTQAQGFSSTSAKGVDGPAEDYRQISIDTFHIISEWHHYAILELMRVDGFSTDPRWISKALGISTYDVRSSIERLARVGLIAVSSDGKWRDTSGGKTSTLPNDFTVAALRTLQKRFLELSIGTLETIPVELRDHTTVTVAIDTKKIPEAKKRILKFRRSLSKFLSDGTGRDEVYNVSISLYPLSSVNTARKERAR